MFDYHFTNILIFVKIKLILAQCVVISSASHQNDNYRTKVLGNRTGVGGDGGGGHHGGRADGDEDQEQREEDHLGAGR